MKDDNFYNNNIDEILYTGTSIYMIYLKRYKEKELVKMKHDLQNGLHFLKASLNAI